MVRSTKGKHPNYFEAVLQLRDCDLEVINFAKGDITREGINLVKTVKMKGGVDLYLADKSFTRSLGKKLRAKFGGETKETASLWGQKDGKEVYRVTVLFRCSGIKKNDLVEYEGDQYKVKLVMAKEIMLQNTKTGEKVHVKYKDIGRVKKVEQ